MISPRSAIWAGAYPYLYATDLNDYHDMGSAGPERHIKCAEMKFDSDAVTEAVSPSSGLFAPNNVLLIDDIDEWKAPEVQAVMNRIAKADREFEVCVKLRSPKKVIKALSVVNEVFDYSVDDPFSWARDIASTNRREIDDDSLSRLLNFCADDEPMFVTTIFNTVTTGTEGETVEWKEIEVQLLSEGKVGAMMLTNSIQNGDQATTSDVCHRILLTPSADKGEAFRCMGMLQTIFRNSLLCSGMSQRDAEEIGAAKNSWGYKKNGGFAKSIGEARLHKCIEIIAATGREIRGESKMNANESVYLAALRLAALCNVKTSNRRGRA